MHFVVRDQTSSQTSRNITRRKNCRLHGPNGPRNDCPLRFSRVLKNFGEVREEERGVNRTEEIVDAISDRFDDALGKVRSFGR